MPKKMDLKDTNRTNGIEVKEKWINNAKTMLRGGRSVYHSERGKTTKEYMTGCIGSRVYPNKIQEETMERGVESYGKNG